MAGFHNTPPGSEFRRNSSWGRTRRPKNVTGSDGGYVTNVATLAAAKVITDAITTASKAKPSLGVYSTENQRFLHLISSTNGTVVNVWVYHYASGKWSELLIGGSSVTLAAAKTKIIEISGADLVAFKVTNASDVFAACSTF
tara:strand:+ start:192 stop:617 length:426 start_codon:yes stop_codon:yes gene_type:complete